jgi:hypothetical protein
MALRFALIALVVGAGLLAACGQSGGASGSSALTTASPPSTSQPVTTLPVSTTTTIAPLLAATCAAIQPTLTAVNALETARVALNQAQTAEAQAHNDYLRINADELVASVRPILTTGTAPPQSAAWMAASARWNTAQQVLAAATSTYNQASTAQVQARSHLTTLARGVGQHPFTENADGVTRWADAGNLRSILSAMEQDCVFRGVPA